MKRLTLTCTLLAALCAPLLAGTDTDQKADLPGWEALETLDEHMARGAAIDLCLREGLGSYDYYYDFSATNTGGGNFTLVGSLNSPTLPVTWSVTGTYSKSTGTLTFTAVNPAPDGCVSYSGSFTSTGTQAGANFNGTWSNDCGLSGTWSGVGSRGICPPLRVTEASGQGPAAASVRAAAPLARVYPNPARQAVQVDLGAYAGTEVRVELLDLNGRSLELLVSGEAPSVLRADVRHLAPGLYVVRVQHAQGVHSLPVQVVR